MPTAGLATRAALSGTAALLRVFDMQLDEGETHLLPSLG
jgi:hypothetical protein